ncbi:MAG: asparaginase domain-containing protein [Burkholderiaceae bacterium]
MSIRLIAAGGTFDKTYDPLRGELGFDAGSGLPALLARARLAEAPAFEVVMLRDSLEMTDADRQALCDACRRAPEASIVIVHGTDTMPETARRIDDAALGKTIVLTGAMVPVVIDGSDAEFNLGYALAAARLARPGVWIAMNARLLPAATARKDRARGVFIESVGD